MTRFSDPLSALEPFTSDYRDLFHDQRLFKGFQATITGGHLENPQGTPFRTVLLDARLTRLD